MSDLSLVKKDQQNSVPSKPQEKLKEFDHRQLLNLRRVHYATDEELFVISKSRLTDACNSGVRGIQFMKPDLFDKTVGLFSLVIGIPATKVKLEFGVFEIGNETWTAILWLLVVMFIYRLGLMIFTWWKQKHSVWQPAREPEEIVDRITEKIERESYKLPKVKR
jgi:hypothetical protein